MPMLPNVFTPKDAKEMSFDPIPSDWYLAEIIKSEINQTKAKDGQYISFQFKVLEGDHEDRFIFTNLNIVNKNEMAVKLAMSDLKGICNATGFPEDDDLEDTTDLHNIPLYIKVTIKPETPQWPAKNEIKGYKSEDEFDNADNPLA